MIGRVCGAWVMPAGLLLVPFFADVVIGEPLYWQGSVEATMATYEQAMHELAASLAISAWE